MTPAKTQEQLGIACRGMAAAMMPLTIDEGLHPDDLCR